MISINTNYGGIFAAKASGQSQGLVDTAMERLSTGKRINNAGDDAAGQAIATRLTAEIEGLSMASRYAADAQSMVDTAEGAMQEFHTCICTRCRHNRIVVWADTRRLEIWRSAGTVRY